jgi:cytochrome c biogenesis protein CcdA
MARYPGLQLVKYEIGSNATSRRIFETVNRQFGITSPGVPTLVAGNRVLVGDAEIRDKLEEVILEEQARMADGTGIGAGTIGLTPDKTWEETPDLTVPLVLAAALADGLNPCALAVLVFLIVSITALGNRRKALASGLAYTAAVFVLYFLAGLGIFTGIRASGIGREIYFAAALIAIAAGLLSLRDAISSEKPPIMKIPAAAGGVIRKYVESASVPAAFVLGLAVGLFELPCTGAIYFSVLNLLGSSMTYAEGLLYLFIYNLIFVLPLVIVIAAVCHGLPAHEAEEWRIRNMRRLRLISGIVLLAMGVIMLALVW